MTRLYDSALYHELCELERQRGQALKVRDSYQINILDRLIARLSDRICAQINGREFTEEEHELAQMGREVSHV